MYEWGEGRKPHSIQELTNSYLTRATSKEISLTTQATIAWNKSTTESGRKHTQAIYVSQKTTPPTLVVYLDSSALIQDFQTDHLLYEQRMAHVGFPVTSVCFKLSNKKHSSIHQTIKHPHNALFLSFTEKQPQSQQKLTQTQKAFITSTTNQLSPVLQKTAKRALKASFLNSRQENTSQ